MQTTSIAHPRKLSLTRLYVTGGRQRRVGFKAQEEWVLFEKGLIVHIDTDRRAVERCVEYETPPELCPQQPSFTFEGGVLEGNRLYTCTKTEALVYELPQFAKVGYVSLPCFNDVHHVRPGKNGTFVVSNTGLDMVLEVTPSGEILREWGVLGESPWVRFSRDVDYRKVPTTKPHAAHPNFTFYLNEELWVTRYGLRDAVCLTDPRFRIYIGAKAPCHDGEIFGGKIYFTTVDGTIVIANAETLEVERVVDLNKIDNAPNTILGWCRGLGIVDEAHMWVGFTRMRETRFKENVRWVKRFIKGDEKPTHVALYDIANSRRLAYIDLEPHGMHAVFGVFPTEFGYEPV
jgi:hypothetical protein